MLYMISTHSSFGDGSVALLGGLEIFIIGGAITAVEALVEAVADNASEGAATLHFGDSWTDEVDDGNGIYNAAGDTRYESHSDWDGRPLY